MIHFFSVGVSQQNSWLEGTSFNFVVAQCGLCRSKFVVNFFKTTNSNKPPWFFPDELAKTTVLYCPACGARNTDPDPKADRQ